MRAWLLLGIFATGCWSERAPAPVTPASSNESLRAEPAPSTSGIRFGSREPPRCVRSIAQLFEQSKDQMARGGITDAMYVELQTVSVETCEEQAWASDVLDCFDASTNNVSSAACIEKLSKEQRDDFMERLSDAMLGVHRLATPTAQP